MGLPRLAVAWLAALTYGWNLLLVTVGPLLGIQGSLSHLWSLAQEEQFYLVLPLVILVVQRIAPRSRLLLWLLALGTGASLALYAVTASTSSASSRRSPEHSDCSRGARSASF